MISRLKQARKVDIVFAILTIVGSLFILYYMFVGYEVGFNSDSATANLLAKEQMLTKQLYPSTWYYANELWTTNQNIPIILFNFFSNNQMLNRSCSILFQSVLLFLTLYYFNKIVFKEKCTILLYCVLLCGVSDYFMENMYGQAAYEINALVVVLSFLLGNISINESFKINIKFLVLLCLVAISQMIGGSRYLIFFVAPFMLAVVCVFCIEHVEDKWQDIKKPIMSIVFWGIIVATICLSTMIFGKYLMSMCHVQMGATGSVLHNPLNTSGILENFGKLILGYLYLFGYAGDCPMMSFMGIVSMLKLIYTILIVLVLPILLSAKYKKETVSVKRIIVFYWVSTFIVGLTLIFTTLNIDISTIRYMFTSIFVAIILDCYYLYKYWLKGAFIPSFVATVGIVFFIILSLLQVKAIWKDYDVVHAEHESVIAEIESRDLQKGFATYWNAYKYTVLSDFSVEIAGIMEDGKTPFYWLSAERYYLPDKNEKETFLMLTTSEYESVGHETLKEYYGREKESFMIGPYVVFVYDYDISVKYQELYPILTQ